MGAISNWGAKIIFAVLATSFAACGKVTNLSQAAGLIGPATTPLSMVSQELLPVSLGIPYKEIITAKGGQEPYSYTITKGKLLEGLVLDSTTGIITGQIDKSLVAQQSIITVQVTDAGGLTAEQSYTLKAATYSFAVAPGDVPVVLPSLTFAMKFSAVGAVEPVKYSLSGALPLNLELKSDGSLMTEGAGVPGTSANTQWPIEVTATDANNVSAAAKFIVRVGEAPAMAALAILSPQLYGVQVGGYAGGISTAGGILPFTFTIEGGALPSGLSMDASTGVISGTIPAGAANSSYAVVIKVVDAGGQSATKTFSGSVSAGNSTLVNHTTTLSQMTASVAYSYTLAVSGGQTPYNFAVSSGTLPTGLSLNAATGVISGTLANAMGGQAFAFVITITDADGQTASKTYTGSVATSAAGTVNIVSTTLPTPTAGSSYLASVGASGGTPPYTFSISAGAVPTGLSLNTSSGIISGTVAHSQKGSGYVYTVTVTDSASLTASQVYSGFVATYTTAIVPAALSAATPGSSYAIGLATTGGEAPYTYAITAGTLPVGLSLNASTGVISGTVAEAEAGGSRNFTIRSTDTNNVQSTLAYALNTNAFVVTLTTATLTDAIESAMYSNGGVNLAATGGTAPYTFEYTGLLPSGIGLTSAGAFFGVPDMGTGALPSGTNYTIYARAVDAIGRASAQVPLTLKVTISAPVVGAAAVSNAVLGATYSHTLSASGGRGPYTFSLGSGTLPTGLSLSGAGVIAGVPTASASCPANTFAVRVTDVLGQISANANKCIATSTGVSITNPSFSTVVVGTAYSGTVGAIGGTLPYSFSASGLPAGVSLNTSTGVLSGFVNDPTGNYTVYITVTDSSPTPLTSTRAFTFKVRDPVSITTNTVARAGTGVVYGPVALAASGGETPYTFSISSGSLPSGLSLSSAGVISGTPALNAAAGISAYNFSVMVTDSSGLTSPAKPLVLNISVAPRIVRSRFPTASVGTTYAYDVERAGGVNPFISPANLASQLTWAATGLPPGLSINTSTGRISGTPSAGADAGSPYTMNVSITDANGITGTRSVTMDVKAAGLTLDLMAARTADPCDPAGPSTTCEPIASKIATLVPAQTTTRYLVYGTIYSGTTAAPTSSRIHIARIGADGKVATPGAGVTSVVSYTPSTAAFITGLDIGDIDNDGHLDIVYADRSNNKIVVVWNSGTLDGNGMPVFSSENSFNMPASGARPYQVKIKQLRPDATNSNKKDLIVSDYDLLTPATASRIVVFLAQNACSANCSGSRASAYSGAGASITAYSTAITAGQSLIHVGGIDTGYFDVPAGAGVCPSIVISGRRATSSNDDYLYLRHQTFGGGVCSGSFATHASTDEKLLAATNFNGMPANPAIADFNNDGISDIATGFRWTGGTNSASVKIYLMPGGDLFPTSPISPTLPNPPSSNYLAASLLPYCLDGATSCPYPSLLVVGGRDRAVHLSAGTGSQQGFISLIPNQGSSPWFEDLTGNNRIDYYAPSGIGSNGVHALPIVSSGLNDIAFTGIDYNSIPYYFMLRRNGSSTSEPFKQTRMLRSMPAYLVTGAEVGTIKVEDFDADGQLDVAAHLVNQASLGIVTGDTAANEPTSIPDPAFNPIGSNFGTPNTWHYQDTMDTGDFNEDGHSDFVVAGNGGRTITVIFGDGTNTITSSVMIDPGITGELFPRAVAADDFDNDGHADIISLNWNQNTSQSTMSFFKGVGDGSFESANEFMLANGIGCADARAMRSRDLNGDGRPELAVLCYGNQALYILRRHTNGTWVRNSGGTVTPGGGANGSVLVMGRLTSTVGTDFIVGGLDITNTYRIITGLQLGAPDGAGAFSVTASLSGQNSLRGYLNGAAIADLNEDGYGDIILAPGTQNDKTNFASIFYYTCRTTGPGACTLESWGGDGIGYTGVTTGDFDNDGKVDFVIGNRTGQRIFDRMITRTLNISY